MRHNSDPITLEVVRNALSSIADEMALVIIRTAYSAIVRDSMDYSTGLCDRHGQVIAHGLTMALHLGSFPEAMAALIREYGNDLQPGDIFVFNDPYAAGGMHLPDVYVIKPIFYQGELEGYAATLVHQIDMSGIAPGSTAVYANEIYQEGLRIPVVKLYEAGRPNETFLKMMALNTRMPDKQAGDMRAQVAACAAAEKGYQELIGRYGSNHFRTLIEDLHDYAERMTRAAIVGLPDGHWSFTDYIDGLGDAPRPIPLKVAVTIKGDEITVDWTGSSPQVSGAINCPSPFVVSAVQLILKCVADRDIPNFAGFTRPLHIVIPEGTIVNPRPPAACAARAIVGWRAIDTLLGAFAQIVPERVPAAGEGGVTFPTISGYDGDTRFVCSETLAGSWGAMPDRDGEFGIPNPGGNLTNQPVEMIEAHYPIRICRYGMVENSGGPGEYRGAPAYVREYCMLAEHTQVVLRSDRRSFLPYGLNGGCPGTPSWNIINPGAGQRLLPVMPMEAVQLQRGDVFTHIGAGGAGQGNPLARDPESVLDDVLEERLTIDYAEQVYGVVIDPVNLMLDLDKTQERRTALRGQVPTEMPAYLKLFHAPLGIAAFSLSDERRFAWVNPQRSES